MDERTFTPQVANSSVDVLGFYDRYATTWDDRFGDRRSSYEFHRTRLDNFLAVADLRPSDRAVELGVGTGPYLEVIAPLVSHLVCIDGSARMLEVLRTKHGRLSNIEPIQLDLEKPIGEQSFRGDILYCFGLIEHIVDLDAFLANCSKMVKPGGRMILVSANGRSPWYRGAYQFLRVGKHCSTDRYYAPEQLDPLLSARGFVSERHVYWGYFPAGVGPVTYRVLDLVGRVVAKTWFRRYAGGFCSRYRYEPMVPS